MCNGAPSNFPTEDFILSFGIEELDVYRRVSEALTKFQDDINHEIVTSGLIDYLTTNYIASVTLLDGSLIISIAKNDTIHKQRSL